MLSDMVETAMLPLLRALLFVFFSFQILRGEVLSSCDFNGLNASMDWFGMYIKRSKL